MTKISLTIPVLLALKDFVAYQITIPWSQITVDPMSCIYMSVLMLSQSVATNIIVFNHLVHKVAEEKEAEKVGGT